MTALLLPVVLSLLPAVVQGQNTVFFNTTNTGNTKAITEWGIEVAWVNADNIRHSKTHMGEAEIDVIFANYYLDEPLAADGEIGPNSKALIDAQVGVASILPNAAWAIGPNVGNTDPYYYNGAALATDRWANLIKATKAYYESTHGKTLAYVMPFNEPDYWAGQGTPQELNTILTLLDADADKR